MNKKEKSKECHLLLRMDVYTAPGKTQSMQPLINFLLSNVRRKAAVDVCRRVKHGCRSAFSDSITQADARRHPTHHLAMLWMLNAPREIFIMQER